MSLIIVFQKKDTQKCIQIYTKMIKYKEIMYKKYIKKYIISENELKSMRALHIVSVAFYLKDHI